MGHSTGYVPRATGLPELKSTADRNAILGLVGKSFPPAKDNCRGSWSADGQPAGELTSDCEESQLGQAQHVFQGLTGQNGFGFWYLDLVHDCPFREIFQYPGQMLGSFRNIVEHMQTVGDMKWIFFASCLHSSCRRLTRLSSVATSQRDPASASRTFFRMYSVEPMKSAFWQTSKLASG